MALSADDFRLRIAPVARTVVKNPTVAEGLPDTLAVVFGCLLIVGGLWGFYGIHNGFGTETLLIYLSDTRPGFDGFFYPDPARPFTSVFYHLSFVLGSLFGSPGSFVPYQLMYGLLWMLRGLLTYMIVSRLMPGRPALAMFSGLFALLHTADGSLNWVGQLNQFGFIFFMLLSFLLLLIALDARRLPVAALAALGAACAAYLAIFSYESPLPVMAAFPVAVAMLRRDAKVSRLLWISSIYLIPLGVFVTEYIDRYLSIARAGAATYQMSVSRHDYSWAALVDDLGVHLKNALVFWNWPISIYYAANLQNYVIASIPALIGTGLITTRAMVSESRSATPFRLDRQIVVFVLVACGLLVASYLVVLLLGDNRNLWRTEFLPGFAAASIMAALLYLALHFVPGRSLRILAAAPLIIIVGVFATFAGVNSALSNGAVWQNQRALMSSIVSNIPDVADGTLFVIRNVSRQADPFGYSEYLDLALHLAYPGRKITGLYYFGDSAMAPGGTNVDLTSGGFRIQPHSHLRYPTQPTTIQHVAVFDYDPSTGGANPVIAGPVIVGPAHVSLAQYDFCAAITGSRAAGVALQRYGPIPAAPSNACPTSIDLR